MNSLSTVTIHHYDDEPNNINSIRDNLLYLVLAVRPEWMRMGEVSSVEDDITAPWKINIHHPSGTIAVLYRIYASADEFCKEAEVLATDVVLIDAYERGAQGEPVLAAVSCITKLHGKIDFSRVFLLSAYCSEIPPELQDYISREMFISKPISVNSVVLKLLDVIGIRDLYS